MSPDRVRYHLTTSEQPYRMGCKIPFYVPTLGRDVDVVVLASRVLGVEMHWAAGRTRPCTRAGGYCEWCRQDDCDVRWKGFLGSWDYRRSRLCIAELTDQAVQQCPAFATYAGKLRGKHLRLRRTGAGSNGLVVATLTELHTSVGHIPPCFDVLDALYRAWNLGGAGVSTDPAQPVDPMTEGL